MHSHGRIQKRHDRRARIARPVATGPSASAIKGVRNHEEELLLHSPEDSIFGEYSEENFDHWRSLERDLLPDAGYTSRTNNPDWSTRRHLVDWVHRAHRRLSLPLEVFFLATHIIDRYLACCETPIPTSKLLGAVALLSAAKYDARRSLTIKELILRSDCGYSAKAAETIARAERHVLQSLDYRLGWPAPVNFVRRISWVDKCNDDTTMLIDCTATLANYILELAAMDHRLIRYVPSLIGAGAYCMARIMIRNEYWSEPHIQFSGYHWEELQDVLSLLFLCCYGCRSVQSSAYTKYTSKRHGNASRYMSNMLARAVLWRDSSGRRHECL